MAWRRFPLLWGRRRSKPENEARPRAPDRDQMLPDEAVDQLLVALQLLPRIEHRVDEIEREAVAEVSLHRRSLDDHVRDPLLLEDAGEALRIAELPEPRESVRHLPHTVGHEVALEKEETVLPQTQDLAFRGNDPVQILGEVVSLVLGHELLSPLEEIAPTRPEGPALEEELVGGEPEHRGEDAEEQARPAIPHRQHLDRG